MFLFIFTKFYLYKTKFLKCRKVEVGLIYMCGSFAGFLFASPIGSLADGWGKKVVIITSIASFVIIFSLYSFVGNYKFMYGIQALQGTSWVAIGAAANAYIADITTSE